MLTVTCSYTSAVPYTSVAEPVGAAYAAAMGAEDGEEGVLRDAAGVVARFDGRSCALCESAVLAGDVLLPYSEAEAEGKKLWGHRACVLGAADGGSVVRPPCKHWRQRGECAYGARCCFAHPPALRGAEPLPERTRGTTAAGRKKRPLVRNSARVGVFRRFLIDAFGLDGMKQGGVLDVAGGKGELAWQLRNLNGVERAVVVDPRPLDVRCFEKRLAYGYYHHNAAFADAKYVDGTASRDAPRRPKHIRALFHADLMCDLARGAEGAESRLADALDVGRKLCWGDKGLVRNEEDEELGGDGPEQERGCGEPVVEEDERGITDAEDVGAALRDAAVVAGMHPDQAAEPLVDYALRMGKAFALTPCCVYSASFTKRKLRDGTPVRTYEQLCEFLLQKHPDVRQTKLAFEGKNVCLWKPAGPPVDLPPAPGPLGW